MSDGLDERVALTPRAAQIAQVARGLLERDGAQAASMRTIAAELSIKAASLYEHFTSKQALHTAIAAAGLHELADEIDRLPATAKPPTTAVATAIRDYASQHPNLYRLITAGDLNAMDPNLATARKRVHAHTQNPDPHAAAALILTHGIIDLQLTNRHPPGPALTATWQAGLNALTKPKQPNPRNNGPAPTND